jgi:CheY-like chemotaxis protein
MEREAGAPFDAVIMDLTVPGGMGGREAMERLLEIDPTVTAIVSSGYSNDPVMANYREYGFQAVLTKPYQLHDLEQVVRRVVAR